MPAGMAVNFLKHGVKVFVWNRSPQRLSPLKKAGAIVCESPNHVSQKADIIIECVSDDEASKSVWLGKDGILAGADTNKVLITSASLSLDWTDELAGICQEQNLKFLDMPLTGSRAGAEGGTLKLLVGGDKKTLESIRQELEIISDRIYYFGSNGHGMRFKLILNTLIAIHVNAAAQTANLARVVGLKVEDVAYALFDAPMGPASASGKMTFANLEQDEDFLNFSVKWLEKDLKYAQKMAKQAGVDFDLLNATQKDFERAMKSGLAERDVTSIFKIYE
jgi:3-hydroxyisobutyrate dehydrogenase-like beta-hydroxyacid dehydrogenase